MSTNTQLNSIIADIEPPLPPAPETPVLGISASLTVALLLAAYLIIRYRQSPRARAHRSLRKLAKELRSKTVDHRHISYQLPALLRQGLCLPQLTSTQALPGSIHAHQQRWQSYIAALDKARYARAEPNTDTLQQLTSETRYWLRQWP